MKPSGTLQRRKDTAEWRSLPQNKAGPGAVWQWHYAKRCRRSCHPGRLWRIDGDQRLFPSGSSGDIRRPISTSGWRSFMITYQQLETKEQDLVITGDYNICHKAITDIHNPVSNKDSSGFLPLEAGLDGQMVSSQALSIASGILIPTRIYSWWSFSGLIRG